MIKLICSLSIKIIDYKLLTLRRYCDGEKIETSY